jgi:hypothetical protein
MNEKNERIFRGVWVPVEIWESQSLSWMEKCLWAEISSLGTEEKPCFASNGYLAKMFHSTESSISNMISKLRSLKMIKQISYDGRNRKILAVLPNMTSSTGEVRVHSQVKSDSTHKCNQTQSVDELRLNPQVNIDTMVDTRVDTKGELSLNLLNFQQRANQLLGRRDTTNWTPKEIKAAKPNLDTCEEDWKLLETFYSKRSEKDVYTRRSMETLLNNWFGEIDKARSYKERENGIGFINNNTF